MYLPRRFECDDRSRILGLIREFPLAILISPVEGKGPEVNHLPLIAKESPGSPGELTLLGHMARANSQWGSFAKEGGADVTAVFRGPQCYVTPRWYRSGRDVPTWNYAVAHLRGKAHLVEAPDALIEILRAQTEAYEAGSVRPWDFELPDDLVDSAALTSAIVGFEIRVERIEGKFKLSQNRSAEDRAGVREGLFARGDESSRKVGELMAELERKDVCGIPASEKR